MVRAMRLVLLALVIAVASCENDLEFRLQLIYDAVDSALDKPQVNRLVLSVMRMLNVDSKDTAIMDECYSKGNKDIHTMRACYTDTTGISVNGVCNKEGIEKYVNSRMGHVPEFFRDLTTDLVGCSCFKKMEEWVQCSSAAVFKMLHKACKMLPETK
ncbi:uncharacterized protein LOC119462726 [Dermacentor silvarum]|uniref:uncharacterized protein LOC119462726 n=1 Tax=Dermacentor silvarum TaxID=543639 RepID=UPI00189A660F|nr:uncharacterized protein LOC119462726 [Dermacentor silvarum]